MKTSIISILIVSVSLLTNTAQLAAHASSSGSDAKKKNPAKVLIDSSVAILGGSANAYSMQSVPRSQLWYNKSLNLLTFVHRATTPSANYLKYDFSTNGGKTWSVDQGPVYVAGDGARYPQALIYNPPGNTNPANAYINYFTTTLDNSNSTWGGFWCTKDFGRYTVCRHVFVRQ